MIDVIFTRYITSLRGHVNSVYQVKHLKLINTLYRSSLPRISNRFDDLVYHLVIRRIINDYVRETLACLITQLYSV